MTEEVEKEKEVSCPNCGGTPEFFYHKKYSHYVTCPLCGYDKIPSKEVPYKMWKELKDEKKAEKKSSPKSLFEEPREPSEIIGEVLESYGCSEEFIKHVVRYVERKGMLDPGWLFNMLVRARTGRRFSETEAYMVVDEIVSAIQQEKRKAEELGKPFPFSVYGLPTTTYHPSYPFYPIPHQPTQYTYTAPPTSPSTGPGRPGGQPYYSQPFPQPPTPSLTEEKVRKILEEALAEKRKEDRISKLEDALIKMREEYVKDREEMRKETAELISKVVEDISTKILEVTKPSQPEEGISKKDLELIRVQLEKNYHEKLTELERKVLEERLSRLESKLEEASRPPPPPSEGYQTDQYRLLADTIKTLVKPGEWYPGRAVSEVVVKLVPTEKPPKREEVKGKGKSIIDVVKEFGGYVEE